MSSFSNPHFMYLFDLKNGKQKLAYGESPADALARNMRLLAINPQDFDALIGAGKAALALDDTQAAAGFFGGFAGLAAGFAAGAGAFGSGAFGSGAFGAGVFGVVGRFAIRRSSYRLTNKQEMASSGGMRRSRVHEELFKEVFSWPPELLSSCI